MRLCDLLAFYRENGTLITSIKSHYYIFSILAMNRHTLILVGLAYVAGVYIATRYRSEHGNSELKPL